MSEKEGITLSFDHTDEYVAMYIGDAEGVCKYTIALTPDIAREAAFKLSWHALRAEVEKGGG